MLLHGRVLIVCIVDDVQSLLGRIRGLDSFDSIAVSIGVEELTVLNEHAYFYLGLFGFLVWAEAEPLL